MENERVCDHTSVGVIARDAERRILLIERKKFPFGWAPPAGHCDGDSYGTACFKEFEEETGLKVRGSPRSIPLANPIKKNKCRREGGGWHEWMIFEVDWEGELRPSVGETLGAKWFTADEIRRLAHATPGLEPVWYKFFQEMGII